MKVKNKTDVILMAALAVSAGLAAFTRPLSDLAYVGLKLGEYIANERAMAPSGLLSYLPTKSGWWDQAWLWNTMSYGLYSLGGAVALKVLAGLVASAFACLVYLLARSRNNPPFTAFAVTAAVAMILKGTLSFNPALPALVLFTAQLLLLDARSRRWYLFAPMYLIWSNIDGSFICGLLYLFVYQALDKEQRHVARLKVAAAALAGAAISPTVWKLFEWPGNISFLYSASTDFHSPFNLPAAGFIIAGVCAAAMKSEKGARVAACIVLAIMGILFENYFFFALLSSVPLVMRAGNEFVSGTKIKIGRVPALAAAVFAIFIAGALAIAAQRQHQKTAGLFDFIKDHPAIGQTLAPSYLGGRLNWVTGKKAAIDLRGTVYTIEAGNLYAQLQFVDAGGWDGLAAEQKIGAAVVPVTGQNYAALARKPNWALVFEGGDYAYFVKNEGLNRQLVERWGTLRPRSSLTGKPGDEVEDLKRRARDYLANGNPYRAKWAWLKVVGIAPNDEEAARELKKIELMLEKRGDN